MVAVTAGELSPLITGLIYCGLITGCHEVYELRRAHEWTTALTRWCDDQPDLVVYTGECLVHRAEVMQHHGKLAGRPRRGRAGLGAVRAAHRGKPVVGERRPGTGRARCIACSETPLPPRPPTVRRAVSVGSPSPVSPCCGSRKATSHAASASIRRALGETSEPARRAGLLPACVEIMLAAGELEEARDASRELEEIASSHPSEMLAAMVAHARGAVLLAGGDAWAALVALRHAGRVWQELGAPYEAARARVLVGLACRELGDRDAGEMELDAARGAFARARRGA